MQAVDPGWTRILPRSCHDGPITFPAILSHIRWRVAGSTAVALVLACQLLAPPAPAEAAVSCDPMSLRDRAAQVVMTGLPGTQADSDALTLVRRHAGSVVLLGRNVVSARQLRRLTRDLRAAAPARLLVAIDEEGGRVARLGEKGITDHLPSARTLARTRTPRQIRRIAERLGSQMAAVGMDWNFAPVLDVADADRNTVIGDRSYSGDPEVVAAAGRAFARGMRAAGILTTGKHFPGHGRTTVDSHERLPTVTASRRQLLRRDVHPFAEALPVLDAVMSAHVRYTALDDRRPASLSPAATRLLRRDLGYEGLLITDALEMGAITADRTIPQAAEQALRAGADILLVGEWTATPRVTTRLVRAVRAERVDRARLNEAVARVLTAKGYGPARIDCLLNR